MCDQYWMILETLTKIRNYKLTPSCDQNNVEDVIVETTTHQTIWNSPVADSMKLWILCHLCISPQTWLPTHQTCLENDIVWYMYYLQHLYKWPLAVLYMMMQSLVDLWSQVLRWHKYICVTLTPCIKGTARDLYHIKYLLYSRDFWGFIQVLDN